MNSRGPRETKRHDYAEIKEHLNSRSVPIMACDGSPAQDFPDKVMPRAAPCTCNKKCRSRSGSVVFLGLFLLSLCLHAVTLVCYLDLRSEVKREIIHQKRDSMLTLAGSDLADPAAVLSPGHPRLDSGSSSSSSGGGGGGGGEGHEVKTSQRKGETFFFFFPLTAHSRRHCFHSSHGGCSCSFTSARSSCSRITVSGFVPVLCYGMFLGNLFYSSLSRSFASSVSRQICFELALPCVRDSALFGEEKMHKGIKALKSVTWPKSPVQVNTSKREGTVEEVRHGANVAYEN